MIEREKIEILSQLINAMNDSVLQLEQCLEKRKFEEAKKTKLIILNLHEKIKSSINTINQQ